LGGEDCVGDVPRAETRGAPHPVWMGPIRLWTDLGSGKWRRVGTEGIRHAWGTLQALQLRWALRTPIGFTAPPPRASPGKREGPETGSYI